MPIKRSRSLKEATIDDFKDIMKEGAKEFMPTYPLNYVNPIPTEPIKYSYEESNRISQLAFMIMQQLDRHTIEDIVAASNIVEQYVKAQSKGQLFAYQPMRMG